MTWSLAQRARDLARLESEQFDLLVIGGGITGVGVALDAASRGLRVALIEKADLASGTSSRSSKLVHGGLRYLKQGEFGLVHEALVERRRLLALAPHLVQPLEFLYPILAKDPRRKRSARAYARLVSVGLTLYDLAGGARIGKIHERVSAGEMVSLMPALDPARLAGGFRFFDAHVDDARLVLSVALAAVHDYGAVIVPRVEVVGLVHDASGVIGAEIRDVLGGDGNSTSAVRASVVINATGVWADLVRSLEAGSDPRSIRPAKGIHLTFRAEALPTSIAAVLADPTGDRIIFMVPWQDRVYIGTTDTDYQGSLEDPAVEASDISYLLDTVNRFIKVPLSADDIVGSWAGLRPLISDPSRPSSTSVSRSHEIFMSEGGLVTITGGKLTTYRKMAAQAVDRAVSLLERKGALQVPPSRSLVVHLGGAGRHAALAAIERLDPLLLEPLVASLAVHKSEAIYAVREEMALTLEDVLSRRTRCLVLDRAATLAAAPSVAELMAPELGWDSAEVARQIDTLTRAID